MLAPVAVSADGTWGLDHGTRSVLAHVYPNANVPVVQLSLDATQPPSFHDALGQRLAVLRDEGVFVIASGNVVHNLAEWRGGRPEHDLPLLPILGARQAGDAISFPTEGTIGCALSMLSVRVG